MEVSHARYSRRWPARCCGCPPPRGPRRPLKDVGALWKDAARSCPEGAARGRPGRKAGGGSDCGRGTGCEGRGLRPGQGRLGWAVRLHPGALREARLRRHQLAHRDEPPLTVHPAALRRERHRRTPTPAPRTSVDRDAADGTVRERELADETEARRMLDVEFGIEAPDGITLRSEVRRTSVPPEVPGRLVEELVLGVRGQGRAAACEMLSGQNAKCSAARAWASARVVGGGRRHEQLVERGPRPVCRTGPPRSAAPRTSGPCHLVVRRARPADHRGDVGAAAGRDEGEAGILNGVAASRRSRRRRRRWIRGRVPVVGVGAGGVGQARPVRVILRALVPEVLQDLLGLVITRIRHLRGHQLPKLRPAVTRADIEHDGEQSGRRCRTTRARPSRREPPGRPPATAAARATSSRRSRRPARRAGGARPRDASLGSGFGSVAMSVTVEDSH